MLNFQIWFHIHANISGKIPSQNETNRSFNVKLSLLSHGKKKAEAENEA